MASAQSNRVFAALEGTHRRQLLLALLEHNPQADVSIPEDIDFDTGEQDALHEEL